MIKPLLKPGDGLSFSGNQLILRTDAQTLGQIRKVIAQIDSPLRNLLISVRLNRSGNRAMQNSSVSGAVIVTADEQAGNVSVRHQSTNAHRC